MKQSIERDKEHSKLGNAQLNAIMGNLQTYKNKMSKRDPTRRVNIPYYRKVIARSKHNYTTPTSGQAIMFTKQIPLLNRAKKPSLSPQAFISESRHLSVHGEHQCAKPCGAPSEEPLGRFDIIEATEPPVIPPLTSRRKKEQSYTKNSSSLLPKTMDITKGPVS